MADILINDSGLLSEIKGTRGTNEVFKDIKYDVQKKDLVLNGIDKYMECIETLNEVIKCFYEMNEEDIHNLEIIRQEWLNLDDSVATRTVADYVKDFGKALVNNE